MVKIISINSIPKERKTFKLEGEIEINDKNEKLGKIKYNKKRIFQI